MLIGYAGNSYVVPVDSTRPSLQDAHQRFVPFLILVALFQLASHHILDRLSGTVLLRLPVLLLLEVQQFDSRVPTVLLQRSDQRSTCNNFLPAVLSLCLGLLPARAHVSHVPLEVHAGVWIFLWVGCSSDLLKEVVMSS